MLTPFKKKKIIRKIYGEQKRMLDEEFEFSSDRELSDEELQHLRLHSERMRKLLAQLMPRRPLDWVAALVRIGLAIIIFILLITPPYTYVRNQYLEPQVTTSTSATGIVVVTNYIAATQATIATRLWNRSEADGPVQLMQSLDLHGMAAGIVPATIQGKPGEAVFWTEPKDGKRIISKLVTDEYFRPSLTTTSTYWSDHDFLSALAVSSGTKSVVAASYRDTLGGVITAQGLDADGKDSTMRSEIALNFPNESPDDFQITPWMQDGWVVTTRVPRGLGSSLFDPTKIVLRFMDSQLRVTTSTVLELSGYEIGPFPQLVPNPKGMAGYTLVATAHPLVRSQRDIIGDDVYIFMFDSDRELTRLLRVTNNGREHDFDTTGYTRTPEGYVIIGAQNIPQASFSDPANGYPVGSGRAYLRFFDQAYDIAGTVIMYDEPAAKGQPDSIGVSHLRQSYIGNKIFFVYDQINPDNSETNKPERTIQGGWIQVRQR